MADLTSLEYIEKLLLQQNNKKYPSMEGDNLVNQNANLLEEEGEIREFERDIISFVD